MFKCNVSEQWKALVLLLFNCSNSLMNILMELNIFCKIFIRHLCMSVSNLASHQPCIMYSYRYYSYSVIHEASLYLHCASFHFTYLDIIYCWSSYYWGQREPRAGPRDSFGHSLTVTNTASLIHIYIIEKNIKKANHKTLQLKEVVSSG